jgi:hypothetical protein
MNIRTAFSVVPFLLAPIFSVGCAQPVDGAANDDQAIQGGATAGFEAALGYVEVNGTKVCTAALVDVDASAKIGGISAAGRQVAMAGGCAGLLKPGAVGVTAFVTQQNGVAVSTPIVAVQAASKTDAAVAIGILAAPLKGVSAIKIASSAGLASAQGRGAVAYSVTERGVAVSAQGSFAASGQFAFATSCSNVLAKASVSASAGAGAAVGAGGIEGLAFVNVDGQLQLAGHIGVGCRVKKIVRGTVKIVGGVVKVVGDVAEGTVVLAANVAGEVLEEAREIGEGISRIGEGDEFIGVCHAPGGAREVTCKIRLRADRKQIRVNAFGRLAGKLDSASAGGTCKDTLTSGFGPCTFSKAGNGAYKAGELITLTMSSADAFGNKSAFDDDGRALYVSTSSER